MKTDVKTNKILANHNSIITNNNSLAAKESTDEFRPGATIAVLALLLGFIVSSVYILISGYLNIA